MTGETTAGEAQDAYEYLGGIHAFHPAVQAGLRPDSTDEDVERIADALLAEHGTPPFDAETLTPALTTWRSDLQTLGDRL